MNASRIRGSTKDFLAERIRAHRREIRDWAFAESEKAPPAFYSSIDLRDAGFKVVPVDSNLFPAGFNNVCPEDIRTASPAFRAHVEEGLRRTGIRGVKNILIIPESHTSNRFYIENLYYLSQIIRDAGFEVRIGWYEHLGEDQGERSKSNPFELVSATEKRLLAYPIEIRGGELSAGGFVPDLVLLNNDFSGGYPIPLDEVSQPILPSHSLGWHTRKKSDHFRHYNALAAEFAALIDIDPWLVQVDTREIAPVNFNELEGTEQVAEAAASMLDRMRAEYERHDVKRKPFVFVKDNSGTYGMGIMTVHDAEELRTMNRRTKNKMSVGKNRHTIQSVVVQEGIPTATLINRLPAEPVIYLLGPELIGGFLRTNAERDEEANLNAPGMVFRKLCMSDLRRHAIEEEEAKSAEAEEEPTLELVYGSVARISALATGRELLDHQRKIPQ